MNVSALLNNAGSNPPACSNRPSADREMASSSITATSDEGGSSNMA
jgi:hypothetical protein